MSDLLQMERFPAGLGATLNADGGVGLIQQSGVANMLITGVFFCIKNISHSVAFAGSLQEKVQ